MILWIDSYKDVFQWIHFWRFLRYYETHTSLHVLNTDVYLFIYHLEE